MRKLENYYSEADVQELMKELELSLEDREKLQAENEDLWAKLQRADEQQAETSRIGETTTTEIIAGANQADEAAMRVIRQRNAEKAKREAERARKAALEREREERAAKEAASRRSGFSRGR